MCFCVLMNIWPPVHKNSKLGWQPCLYLKLHVIFILPRIPLEHCSRHPWPIVLMGKVFQPGWIFLDGCFFFWSWGWHWACLLNELACTLVICLNKRLFSVQTIQRHLTSVSCLMSIARVSGFSESHKHRSPWLGNCCYLYVNSFTWKG